MPETQNPNMTSGAVDEGAGVYRHKSEHAEVRAMAHQKLLHEIVTLIDHVLTSPACYYELPVATEAFMIGLVGVSRALETGESLGKSLWQTWEEVKELTAEIPADPGHSRHLCDEQIVPRRKHSNRMLMKRGPSLCARLLESWPENTAAGIAEEQSEFRE